jgi:hypothetical protein
VNLAAAVSIRTGHILLFGVPSIDLIFRSDDR